MHSFFHSFVHYSSIHQSFIIHFSSRSAVGGRVDSERWLHLAQKDGKEAAEGEREESECCAALLKIQIGFSFCVQENAPIAVTPSEK
jgi:hypothetical protein